MAEVLGLVSSCLTIIELSAKIVGWCVEYSASVKNAAADIQRLQRQVEALRVIVQGHRNLLEGHNGVKLSVSNNVRQAVDACCGHLFQVHEKLKPRKRHSARNLLGIRALTWPFSSSEVVKLISDIQSWMDIMDAGLQIDQCAIILDTNQQMVLSKLPTASGASYNSHQNEHAPRCHPETRLDLLSQIHQWAQDPQTKPLYWLNGMAGTGKSTISRTLAAYFDSIGSLGASFFFKRGEHDRSASTLLFSTIAYQLAYAYPAALPHIIQVLETEPSISQKPLKEQFQRLVVGPLSRIQAQSQSLIIIIDALDECDSDQDIRIIISAFTQANSLNSARLKVLVTSRPELPIRLGFSGHEGVYETLILHEVPPLHVETDLFIYLMHEVKLIRDSFNRTVPLHRHLSLDWPNPLHIAILARSASPLFIIAATMMRIIGDRVLGSPDDQLTRILDDLTLRSDIGGNISATYLSALSPIVAGRSSRDKDYILQQFRAIIGPLILLQTPLSIGCLGRLLDIPHNLIDQTLDSLHSVLNIPNIPGGVVRLFHLSFRDFLLNAENPGSTDFQINEANTHKELAFQCLDLLMTRTPLHKNICNFQWPGTPCCGISTEFKMHCLPAEVQYACLYWVHHLRNSQVRIHDGDRVHEFLKIHFLHWLEALSILGRVSETITQISMLQSLAQFEAASEVLSFLEGARRFILAHRHIASRVPLQLYSSALIFSPVNSVIRQTFVEDMPPYITLFPKVDQDWSAALMSLEGHQAMVFDAVFSPDSRLLASASDDATVRIWEAGTGEHLQTLEGHDNSVYSVAFSHDSKFLASGSKDCTVRLWSVQTGDQLETFTGHNNTVRSVVFSPDSRTVISGSDDTYVRVWSVATAAAVHTLEGHTSPVEVCACSPSGNLIVSGSLDDYIRVWSIHSGQHIRSLNSHERGVT
ncbi:NACHT domain-containing protein [Fusarium keratoplasticum]|uniref:NACHT domain-containing protein n=1 Tax=Fusarium keratoplasticum TaxID=1328300 RepID=A0ACC0QWH5_9HYPO|nr:NACHT domain-containing protein [Fusarium keratoplasticum]KAI8668613.1 NACHT domain-containing protein [Fusarium keratoplasticum]